MHEITNADLIEAWELIPRENMEAFGEEGDFVRQYLLNPAMFGLLGDVADAAILDAGCGQGYLARLLAKRGAQVTGIEPATALLNFAKDREQSEPLGIEYLRADLSSWSPVAAIFDVVIANMVFMDIVDYKSAMANCVTSLRPNGRLIFSILHPCFEEPGSAWKQKQCVEVRDYFNEITVKQTYGYFIHRPLGSYLSCVIETGCAIQQVLEPRLDPAIAARYGAERYASVPGYLVVSAVKL